MTNAVVLSRLNGSLVISGYPKTGTTYLSHLAEEATGKPYIEGSMRFALKPSVIHTHSRRVPDDAIFSFRPIDKVISSFVTQPIAETDADFVERIRSETLSDSDCQMILGVARGLVNGTARLPSPTQYYASVKANGGTIVNILDLNKGDGPAHKKLQSAWRISPKALLEAIARASKLSEARRNTGHEFYNRPTTIVTSILSSDAELSAMIRDEAARTEAIVKD